MPRYASPQGFLLAAVLSGAAVLASIAGAEAKLADGTLESEQQACLQSMEGQENAEQVCRCMAEGLSEALDDEAYQALARLIHQGEESPAGLAAREAAKGAIAGCLQG